MKTKKQAVVAAAYIHEKSILHQKANQNAGKMYERIATVSWKWSLGGEEENSHSFVQSIVQQLGVNVDEEQLR